MTKTIIVRSSHQTVFCCLAEELSPTLKVTSIKEETEEPGSHSTVKLKYNTIIAKTPRHLHLNATPPITLIVHQNRTSAPSKANSMFPSKSACKDNRCYSLLTSIQRSNYKQCEAQHSFSKGSANVPARCVFRESKDSAPVALVSVPGSGNTWVRGLLEKATGVCTGSIYCDVPLRKKGFVGEHVSNDNVLVVKTHTSDYQWKGAPIEKRNHEDALYGAAILLLRNPLDTFVTERHRLKTLSKLKKARPSHNGDLSHINEVGREEFGMHIF